MKQLNENKDRFLSEGYAVFNDLFPVEDLLAFRKMLIKAIQIALTRAISEDENIPQIAEGQEIDQGLLALWRQDPNHVAFVQRVVSRSPEFFRLTSNPNLNEAARYLLGLESGAPLYLLSNGVIFTMPNAPGVKKSSNFKLDWHKDIFYTIPKSCYAHMWVPLLHNADEEIGTLQVIPGSHKEGIGKQIIDVNAAYNYRYGIDPEVIKGREVKSIDVKLGQALIFDYRLIHRSGFNSSDKVRCSMIGLIHDVSNPEFLPVSTHYSYYGQTPEAYFAEVFGDEQAQQLAYEQAANAGEPKGGV